MLRTTETDFASRYVECAVLIALLAGCGPSRPTAGFIVDGPSPRADGAAVAIGDKVYFVGGLTARGGVSAELEAYNPPTQRWTSKASMPTARATMAAVALEGQLYAMGGRKDNDILNVVECYNPGSNTWSQCPPMPTPRWRHMAAVLGGKIYVFGGIAGVGEARRVLDVVEVYDPSTASWSSGKPMPAGRSGAAIAVLGSKIYLLGGKLMAGPDAPATERVDIYDAASNSWARGTPLPERRVGGCAATVRETVYLLGGNRAGGITAVVDAYSPAQIVWRLGAPLSMRRNMHACAQIGDTTYLIGGTEDASGSSSSFHTRAEAYRPEAAQ
jgi:N-acetylneuraminic acid mutarotase